MGTLEKGKKCDDNSISMKMTNNGTLHLPRKLFLVIMCSSRNATFFGGNGPSKCNIRGIRVSPLPLSALEKKSIKEMRE